MTTQVMAAVLTAELRSRVDNLGARQHEISVALDMLFFGF